MKHSRGLRHGMAVGALQGSAEAVHMHNPMNVIIMSVLFINEGHLTEEYKHLFTKVGKTTNNQVRIARSGQFHNIDKSMVYIIFLHLLYAYDILPSVKAKRTCECEALLLPSRLEVAPVSALWVN